MNPEAKSIISLLGLAPLPGEGGYFRETYRADEELPAAVLPARYDRGKGRAHSTQIYFLITRESPSLMHLVQSDEVFHHYLGDAVEQLQITTNGVASVHRIGKDLHRGERPQVLVPRCVWQGCRLAQGPAGYALLGCTVSPGFDWDDFQLGSAERMRALVLQRDTLVEELIVALAARV